MNPETQTPEFQELVNSYKQMLPVNGGSLPWLALCFAVNSKTKHGAHVEGDLLDKWVEAYNNLNKAQRGMYAVLCEIEDLEALRGEA